MTDALTKDDVLTFDQTDDGDHDKFSHYVLKNQQVDALVGQQPLVALCGKVWVPTEIDNTPEKRPVCPDCLRIYENTDWKPEDEA